MMITTGGFLLEYVSIQTVCGCVSAMMLEKCVFPCTHGVCAVGGRIRSSSRRLPLRPYPPGSS